MVYRIPICHALCVGPKRVAMKRSKRLTPDELTRLRADLEALQRQLSYDLTRTFERLTDACGEEGLPPFVWKTLTDVQTTLDELRYLIFKPSMPRES
jgi:hypothetical protein